MSEVSMALEPKSDQINADDLIGGPQTFTIEKVTKGSSEQKVNIHLVERPGRAYRPSLTMRRMIVIAWGEKTSTYAGRRLTLYRDGSVKFGGDQVGGIKISHMSHIEKRLTPLLTATRGKKAPHTVDPLPTDAPVAGVEPTPDDVAGCTDHEALKVMWRESGPTMRGVIEARVADLHDAAGQA